MGDWAGVGTVLLAIFGLWKVLSIQLKGYEERNEKEHDRLRKAIEEVQKTLNRLVGRQAQRDVDQLTPDK